MSSIGPRRHRHYPIRVVTTFSLHLGVLALALVVAPAPAAADRASGARLVLHVAPPVPMNACGRGVPANCTDAVTSGGLVTPDVGPWRYVYLIAAGGTDFETRNAGIAGIQFGLDYQGTAYGAMSDRVGLDIFEWNGCATAEYRSDGWPAAGSSNVIIWNHIDDCQPSHQAVAGYFYVGAYGPDRLQLSPHAYARQAHIADCTAAEYRIDGTNLGSVAFSAGGVTAGCNPCQGPCAPPAVPVPPPPPPPPPPPITTQTARLVLHIVPRTAQAGCATGQLTDPNQAVTAGGLTTGAGTFHNVYLLAVRGTTPTLAGLECGITYQEGAAGGTEDGVGIDVLGWTLCADTEVRSSGWPAAGGSNRIVWNSARNCRTDAVTVAGYFYVGAYAADDLVLTGYAGDPSGNLADCAARIYPVEPIDMGVASFSPGAANPGCNPLLKNCAGPTAVARVTWSRIKSLVAGGPGR